MEKQYVAVRLDGTITKHVSRAAVERAKRRATGIRTIVETRRVDECIPAANDAEGWDRYRLRHGIAAR